jgi:hypothetical protein
MTHAHETDGAYAEPAFDLAAGQEDLDLERVVWDPEYRDEVRELLKGGE